MRDGTIQRKNLDQEIYDRLIGKIVNAEFEPGQQLFINDLVEEFGVSCTPIIQAVKMMSSNGYLDGDKDW